jgi:thiol-disulfide isomerase/thioredoxin
MKKIFFSFIVLLFPVCFLRAQDSVAQYDKSPLLPPFQFYSLDGKTFTPQNIPAGKFVELIFFNPECDFCEDETDSIKAHIDQLQNVEFVMISYRDSSKLSKFVTEYRLSQYSNIHVVWDKDHQYSRFYTFHYTPSIHLFSPRHLLLTFIDGTMTIQTLMKNISSFQN